MLSKKIKAGSCEGCRITKDHDLCDYSKHDYDDEWMQHYRQGQHCPTLVAKRLRRKQKEAPAAKKKKRKVPSTFDDKGFVDCHKKVKPEWS